MAEKLSVSAIHTGTVIDHIPAGQATNIMRLLALTQMKNTMTIGLNLQSKSLGLKDIIKVEQRRLTATEIQQIAVFAPNATINHIKEYAVAKKQQLTLPKEIQHIFICPNDNCITRAEATDKYFHVSQRAHNVRLHCKYCETIFLRDELLLVV